MKKILFILSFIASLNLSFGGVALADQLNQPAKTQNDLVSVCLKVLFIECCINEFLRFECRKI